MKKSKNGTLKTEVLNQQIPLETAAGQSFLEKNTGSVRDALRECRNRLLNHPFIRSERIWGNMTYPEKKHKN